MGAFNNKPPEANISLRAVCFPLLAPLRQLINSLRDVRVLCVLNATR